MITHRNRQNTQQQQQPRLTTENNFTQLPGHITLQTFLDTSTNWGVVVVPGNPGVVIAGVVVFRPFFLGLGRQAGLHS